MCRHSHTFCHLPQSLQLLIPSLVTLHILLSGATWNCWKHISVLPSPSHAKRTIINSPFKRSQRHKKEQWLSLIVKGFVTWICESVLISKMASASGNSDLSTLCLIHMKTQRHSYSQQKPFTSLASKPSAKKPLGPRSLLNAEYINGVCSFLIY